MGMKAIAKLAPVHVVYTISAGEAADIGIFVADQDYEIMDVRECHSIAGASSTALSAALALDSTANTPVQSTLTSTLANRKMDKGEQIALNYTGTVTAYEGSVHIVLKVIRTNTSY